MRIYIFTLINVYIGFLHPNIGNIYSYIHAEKNIVFADKV